MKPADWYSRAMLTIIAVLLLCVAAELRIANQLQSALNSTAQAASADRSDVVQPTSVVLRQPAASPENSSAVTDVRIVSYVYNGKEVLLGDGSFSAPSKSRGLPVSALK